MFRPIVLALVFLSASYSDAVIPESATPTVIMSGTSSTVREPVLFSAIKASQSTTKGSNKIVFTKTQTDIGYGWRSDLSEFVCFYPGAYFFTFSALPRSGSPIKIGLMKNNEEVVSASSDRLGATSASNSVVLNLAKNERVYLTILDGSLHESKQDSRSYTSFSGFRLF